MTDRVRCTRPGCSNRILPATAARTGGICRPCENAIAWERHREYVRANRREVDPFEGVTDPVEVVRILVRPKSSDELVIEKPFSRDPGEYFAALPAHDVDGVIALAVSYLSERTYEAETIARCLAAFTTADLTVLQQAWLDAGSVRPGILFRGASEDIQRRIKRMAASRDAFIALAWIGDAAAHEHSWEAGWELDEHGRRRDLFLPSARALLPSANDVAGEERERCPWCKSQLEALLQHPERIVTCPSCGMAGPIFMQLDDAGRARWHPGNVKPRYGPFERQPPLRIGVTTGAARGPLHAADVFLPGTHSQIGGAPAWVQNAEFPSCPGCRRTMVFIAQLVLDELLTDGEGCFYAFRCDACRVTATTFQTT